MNAEDTSVLDSTQSTPDIQVEALEETEDEEKDVLITNKSHVLEEDSQLKEHNEIDSIEPELIEKEDSQLKEQNGIDCIEPELIEKVLDTSEAEDQSTTLGNNELNESVQEPAKELTEEISSVEKDTAVVSEPKDPVTPPSSNSLTVNKRFVVNTLKQVDDHNRYRKTQESKTLRKFQNEERKKHTIKNLQNFSEQKTLYSDFFEVSLSEKKKLKQGRVKVITPLEQVKKLILSSPDNDIKIKSKETDMSRIVKKSRFSIDKTLLNNHLRHYSVHNRLKEENEMWEKYNSPTLSKSKGLQSKSAKMTQAKRPRIGSMYADREPGGNVKTAKFKEIPDDAPSSIGSATQELLDYEESMPDRWGHSGFKEIYVDKPKLTIKKDDRKSGSRKVVIGSDLPNRINKSIELSDDDDDDVQVLRKRRKGNNNTRSILIRDDPEPSITRKISNQTKKRDNTSLASKPKKKVTSSNLKTLKKGTLQSDLIESRPTTYKITKKRKSPERWNHDGFEGSDNEGSHRHKTKSIAISPSTDEEVSISPLKNSIKNKKESSSEFTESDDEWMEKDSNLPKNDARRKLKRNMKNKVVEKGKTSVKARIGKRRPASDDDESSLTDSSSDERYKQKIRSKPRREEQKFFRR